jgi:hypothetical protein
MESRWSGYLRSLWRKNGRIYRPTSIISDPAVELEDVESGERVTLVIGCRIYEEYERLIPNHGGGVKGGETPVRKYRPASQREGNCSRETDSDWPVGASGGSTPPLTSSNAAKQIEQVISGVTEVLDGGWTPLNVGADCLCEIATVLLQVTKAAEGVRARWPLGVGDCGSPTCALPECDLDRALANVKKYCADYLPKHPFSYTRVTTPPPD